MITRVDSPMVVEVIETLLSDRIGLEPRSLARRAIARTMSERMRACGLDREDAYLDLVTSSEEELKELIEALVVPETWFFRDREPFVFLKQYVARELLPSLKGRAMRILSLPGSTGEEPYSVVMALMDLGLGAGDFMVDSVDISKKAIRKAMEAVYSPHSFREKDDEFRRKYFHPVDEGYRLIPEVREAVHFVHGNLLARDGLGLKGPYDAIFFRNLLIYLNERARKEAVRIIDGLLKENGILFLGYAETQKMFFPDYDPVSHPRAYAARKVGKPSVAGSMVSLAAEKRSPRGWIVSSPPACPIPSAVSGKEAPKPRRAELERSGVHGAGNEMSPESVAHGTEGPGNESSSVLERAQRLADEGKLLEADLLCMELLQSNATCADAYCLLGVIALAGGDEDRALRNFNKVVYLSPSHPDALFHLSLLMDKRGLRDQAERYRARARRANEGVRYKV
jgi:chemotaxis protein methyltransferase WspC